MKRETYCINHECEKCGEKLYPAGGEWIGVFFIGLITIFMFAGLWFFEIRAKKIQAEPNCYQREYIQNSAMTETYKTWEIKCL